MRKLILRCGLSVGDIVMLTAAVRDLHLAYPGQYLTDVRTFYPELWEHNPYVSPLSEADPEVKELDCFYPLINSCNRVPYHCLHGFIEFLNERLLLGIKLTTGSGDIHLSDRERSWYSQVQELTRETIPFWIIDAGGKYDVTIKWWETRRYQEVVDHFRGKIQFVQVGRAGHHHPRLEGVIDLRGQTDLRQLIRLVHHAQGVLCPVTALMHLAAAVETKAGEPTIRPCVVIAGGREPAHWEAYPGHQFIHTNGALRCCAKGGCWRDRTIPLRDGDKRDRPDALCVDVVGGLPRCMDMITAAEVIRRIESYYHGGVFRQLTPRQFKAAVRGVKASANNAYDTQALNLHNSGLACDRFVAQIPAYPGNYSGRGIVICGGGVRYFTNLWVCVSMLRHLGCGLPVQCWHFGAEELDPRMASLLAGLGVQSVDAHEVRKRHPARVARGWQLKPYAILHSPYREVLLLDADNVPVINPEFLFNTKPFQTEGAIFWPDYPHKLNKKTTAIWRSCGLRRPPEPEFESGQIVVDKQRCWRALCLSLWFNENADFYYQYVHGDKETFHLAFRRLQQPYALIAKPIHTLTGTMCQHDFTGRRLFQHRNRDKWDFLLCNRQVKDFWFEAECRGFIRQLHRLWDGGLSRITKQGGTLVHRRAGVRFSLAAVMISCAERDSLRRQTLQNLGRTDWGDVPLEVHLDQGTGADHESRQTRCSLNALKAALHGRADYLLFLEDDLEFNRHLRHNLQHWGPLRAGTVTLASLYNPRVRELACDVKNRCRIVSPGSVFGSQAFVISRAALEWIVARWHRVAGLQDIKISRLAARLGNPIVYHAPSLVQHIGAKSVWGAHFHQAFDFDPDWKA